MKGKILEIVALLMALVSLTIGLPACAVKPAPLAVPSYVRPYDITHTARSQIARPYHLGGSSPESGFDCSGLVSWTYAQHGINLPRTTGEQIEVGHEVGKHELQPGDLVFFKIKGKGFFSFFAKSSLHVGLYTNDGKFVHAPGSGKSVREDHISNVYWDECYLMARRILGPLPR
ncbi:MAG: C40 family peptidase [Pseudomonadota bacterium]